MNAGSQSAGVLILHSFPSNLLVSVTLFLLACQGTMSCLSLSLGLGFSICLVDRHPYQWLFFLQQSWRGFIWSHACLVAYTFNHTACKRRFSSSENVVMHSLLIGSAVPAVGSLTEVLEFCMFDELGFSKADKWLVLGGGMSPGNSKVGFIYADSYTGDFYHHKCLCSIHEINVSMFSLIGRVLLACACHYAMLAPTLCFRWSILGTFTLIFFAKLLQRKRSRLFLFSCVNHCLQHWFIWGCQCIIVWARSYAEPSMFHLVSFRNARKCTHRVEVCECSGTRTFVDTAC